MEPDVRAKDPEFVAIVMSILRNTLSRADSPGELGAYLTEEIRNLVGAQCVVIIQCLCTATLIAHRVVSVSPLSKREWAESMATDRLFIIAHSTPGAHYWRADDPSEVAKLLRQEGFGLSMVFPLNVGDVRVGAILVLGLPDKEQASPVFDLLNTLSTIVALVLRNSFLFERQEQIIRERTEEVLKANEQLQVQLDEYERVEHKLILLSFALGNVHEAAFLIDENAHLHYVNEESCRILGYTCDELLELSVPDIDPDFPLERWHDHWRELEEQGSLMFESRHRAKDGHIIPVEVNANHFEYDGRTYNMTLARDITERKKSEEQLRKEAERGELLLELYVKSPHLSDRELYDYALKHAVQLTDSTIGFLHLVSDDQKCVILTTWNKEALKECEAVHDTHYSIEKAGNWADCVHFARPVVYNDYANAPNQKGLPAGHPSMRRFMSIPVIEDDKVRIIFGVGNKVEEYNERDVIHLQLAANELHKIFKQRHAEQNLRESEARLKEAQRIAHLGHWELDLQKNLLFWSDEIYRIFGLEPQEFAATYEAFLDHVHPEDRAFVNKAYNDSVKNKTKYDIEHRILPKDGEEKYVNERCVTEYDEGGSPLRSLGTVLDITERKQAEAHKREFYRSTILAATDGKLLLADRKEVERIAGSPLARFHIARAEEFSTVRKAVYDVACSHGMDEARASSYVVAVGEAVTNAIKHAGGGLASIHILPGAILSMVSDRGPGIEAMTIPKVALTKGYTTTGTLGMGYKIIISLADRVYLATGPAGTTVGIEIALKEAEATPYLGAFSYTV